MNNPPAFPLHNHGAQTLGLHVTGMTLRDYMAAKAMSTVPHQTSYNMKPKESHEDYVSRRAYDMADAMLKAREK